MYFEASVAVTEKTNQPNKLPNKKDEIQKHTPTTWCRADQII